jgi:hypothetical protein
MRIFSGSRVLAWTAVLAVAPVATLAFEGTASAVHFPGAAVTCAQLEGTTQPGIETASLSHCTAGVTGGSGQISNFTLGGGNVTWANGTTTDYSDTATQKGKGCHASVSKEYVLVGSVTSSTNSSTPPGQQVKIQLCFFPSTDQARAAAPKKIISF